MLQTLKSATQNHQLIHQILARLGENVSAVANNPNQCGLLSGLSGDLLFLYKLSQYDAALVDEALFSDKLDFVQRHLSAYANLPNLGGGVSGQGWFLEYINQDQGDDYDPQMCEEIDNILNQRIANPQGDPDSLWPGEIEMILGLGGIAIYAAKRAQKAASNGLSPELKLYQQLISHFENAAVRITDNTLSWSQPADSSYRFNIKQPTVDEFNLGLAHGVPGIIAAILPALNIPSLRQQVTLLLRQSCDWLLAQELTDQRHSCFATSCNNDAKPISRLGWCYGDLTIALTLARVGKALDIPAYIEKARHISLHSTARDAKTGNVMDAGLCHGSAGLILIFQLLHQQLGDPELLQAADNWLLYTLNSYQDKDLEGFYRYNPPDKNYQEDTTLLMGYGGIGLCLLAALGEQVDWADCLLMA